MAEDQYRRLTCVSCPGTFVPKKPDHRACSKRCARVARQPLAQLGPAQCTHCGETFQRLQPSALYCGTRCKVAAWRAANPDGTARHRATELAKLASRPKPQRTPRQKADPATHHARAAEAERLRALARHRLAARVLVCPDCGAAYCPLYGAKPGPAGRCSLCAADRARAVKRAGKRRHGSTHRQRARRAGVAYEPVDLLAVLERDHWRCQLCGIDTPRTLRGTTEPRAPEIDHVIPLAAGGSHTAANCQCACRGCNVRKGADPGWRPPQRRHGDAVQAQ